MTDRPTILVLDDEPLDQMVIRMGIIRYGVSDDIHCCANGEEGLVKLEDLRAERPDRRIVVLCDVNMPRMNGFDFLERVRNQPHLAEVPVFFLSSSTLAEDVSLAFELGATGYLDKSRAGSSLVQLAVGGAL